MLNSYQKQLSRDIGFSTHPLAAMRVENSGGVPTPQIVDALERLPGVAAVSAASSVPFMGFGPLDPVSTDAAGTRSVRAERVSIDPAFFVTIDVAMRAGRAFTTSDTPSTHTAIVNEAVAARLFPNRGAVGQQIWVRGAAYDVIGVVAQYVNVALQPTCPLPQAVHALSKHPRTKPSNGFGPMARGQNGARIPPAANGCHRRGLRSEIRPLSVATAPRG